MAGYTYSIPSARKPKKKIPGSTGTGTSTKSRGPPETPVKTSGTGDPWAALERWSLATKVAESRLKTANKNLGKCISDLEFANKELDECRKRSDDTWAGGYDTNPHEDGPAFGDIESQQLQGGIRRKTKKRKTITGRGK